MGPKRRVTTCRQFSTAISGCQKQPASLRAMTGAARECSTPRGVPFALVKAAMLTAVARRTFRRGDPLPRIRALHFFWPVIDELLEMGVDPGYVQYLECKLQPLAAQKRQTLGDPTMGSG